MLLNKRLKIRVPATSANLGPGFDTLGLALSMYNNIYIESATKDEIIFKNKNDNLYLIEPDNNIFFIILKKELKKLNIENENFKIIFENDIPLTRGLGSSSAIIVSAIMAAYLISNTKTTKKNILNLSLEYEKHPDNITPAIYGGFTISIVSNKKIIFQKTNVSNNDISAVIVIPNHKMNTKDNRNILPKKISIEDTVFNIGRSSLLACTFFSKDWLSLKEASKDKIHQDKRCKTYPVLFNIMNNSLKNGALMSTLSGSGSTILSLVKKNKSEYLYKSLKQQYKNFEVIKLNIDNKGLIWEWIDI